MTQIDWYSFFTGVAAVYVFNFFAALVYAVVVWWLSGDRDEHGAMRQL